jgi:hypothetical protein
LTQDVIEQTDALDFYPCGRLERSIDELETEEGNARYFLAVRPRVRSTARHDGEEDSQCCLHGGGAFPQPGIPGTAPPAKQMGHYVGRLIAARVAGGPPLPPFRYRHLGDLATIGRRAAVVKLGRLELTGFLGWLFWSVVHIYFLIEVRDRFIVCCRPGQTGSDDLAGRSIVRRTKACH